jgi:hypothetical protein
MGGGGGAPQQPGIRPTLQGNVSMNAQGQPVANVPRPGGGSMQVPLNPQGGPVQQAQAAGTPLVAQGGQGGNAGLVPPPPPGTVADATNAMAQNPAFAQAVMAGQGHPDMNNLPDVLAGADVATAHAAMTAAQAYLKAEKKSAADYKNAIDGAYKAFDDQSSAIYTPMLNELAAEKGFVQKQLDRAERSQTQYKEGVTEEFEKPEGAMMARNLKLMQEAAEPNPNTPLDRASAAAHAAMQQRHKGVLGFGRKIYDTLEQPALEAQKTAALMPTMRQQVQDEQKAAQNEIKNYKDIIGTNLAVNKAQGAEIRHLETAMNAINGRLYEVRKAQVDAYEHGIDKIGGSIDKAFQQDSGTLKTIFDAHQKADLELHKAEVQAKAKKDAAEARMALEKFKQGETTRRGNERNRTQKIIHGIAGAE